MSTRYRCISAALAIAVLAALPPAARPVDAKTARRIDAEIEKNKAEIVKIRRFIHMNPELGNREVETARLIAARLSPRLRGRTASPDWHRRPQGGQAGPRSRSSDMDTPVRRTGFPTSP
jgi:hypothetical protein